MIRPMIQRVLGGPHDPFSRAFNRQQIRQMMGDDFICENCHEPILADAEVQYVNNFGPVCSDACFTAASKGQ